MITEVKGNKRIKKKRMKLCDTCLQYSLCDVISLPHCNGKDYVDKYWGTKK